MTAQQKRQPSQQAQAAKAIKGYARAMGIDCKASSSSFSMGDSVRWTVSDVRPEKFAALESMADRHQYGSFDGMQDLYVYTNRREDLPQSKYVTGCNVFSDAMLQAAFDWVRTNCPSKAARLPADYASAQTMNWHTGTEHCCHYESVNAIVLDVLRGSSQAEHYDWVGFWDQVEGVTSAPESAPETVPAMRIEQHTHTKKGFDMYIFVLADRIDRADFDALREKARDAGGWYSRAWGTTPGGFAFKEREKAEAFAGVRDLSCMSCGHAENGATLH